MAFNMAASNMFIPNLAPREFQPCTPSVRSSHSSTSSPQSIPTEKRKKAAALLHNYEKILHSSPSSSPILDEKTYHGRQRVSKNQPTSTQHLTPRQRRKSDEPMQALPDMMSTLKFENKSKDYKYPSGGRKRPLDRAKKSKAALIRFLGACPICKRRKVTCSLEHHDIASLRNMETFLDTDTVYTSRTSPTLSPLSTGMVDDIHWGAPGSPMGHDLSRTSRTEPFLYSPRNDTIEYDFGSRNPPPTIRLEQDFLHTGLAATDPSFNDPALFPSMQDDLSFYGQYQQTLDENDLTEDFAESGQENHDSQIQEPRYPGTTIPGYSPMFQRPLGSHMHIAEEPSLDGEIFKTDHIENRLHIGTRSEYGGEMYKYTCSVVNCIDSFGDIERLQDHFSTYHKQFERLDEPRRLVCSQCFSFSCHMDNRYRCCSCNDALVVHVYGSETSSHSNDPFSAQGSMENTHQQDGFYPPSLFPYSNMGSFDSDTHSFTGMNNYSFDQGHHVSRHSTRKCHAQRHKRSYRHSRRCVLHDPQFTTGLIRQPYIRAVILIVMTAWAISLAHDILLSHQSTYITLYALDISYSFFTITLVILSIALWQVATLLHYKRRQTQGHHCSFSDRNHHVGYSPFLSYDTVR